MTLQDALTRILLLLGIGFLVANVLKGLEIVRWLRRRRTALLVWPGPKPPYYGLMLGIGVMLGLLVLFKAFVQAALQNARSAQPQPIEAAPVVERLQNIA